ncbi:hypothetical protein A3J17_05095 [Candidatus Curtissbacteria bacterium RIFCSPLOWO2_02_FULL_40_11]|uniref:Type II secretion system protein GspF domain-containing protein n=2 Tax=Candidatus Curtissiibacteriota TaxID=1752717 RepID=A0A1F5G8D2_9BACT|nr:MAG: hypothetical protein A2775_00120 [Candidatus Curtissbacteria bacterium RIFCSPHIGHO2_01_FULL_39_57]OGD88130.1 MAG: hypothetical protein A3D04_01520 [Candidatus Curtissbacteria bacterium RIFCSPHIGHO2_02_FULL_40_16b]OGE00510.1 MAG: hypothetical protein A3J17_05095 [Candidatus Curtissbacteria bacterium RIFCSPLOWO2_02_FULL_40_11]OGE13235.1 MAG: hypothetical protein A3G14_00480 [Candidatus Curtissbacteria bacterium RIFCSPLOWO2_12_FULL_38_9]
MKSIPLNAQEKLNIVESLATLLASGIPIIETVESLIEESKGNSLKILQFLKEDLNQGKTISYSLARHPKAFDPITVNLLKAAEEAGTLETTLKDLTHSIKKDIDFSSTVKSSLIYPILVLVILFAVIVLNLFFVIPRISQVFTRLKIDVPLPTKILIATSNFATENLIFVIFALFIITILIYLSYKSKKSYLGKILFSLPPVSKLIIEIDLARFTRSMALLLKSGIPIDSAIELSDDVINKNEIKIVLKDALKQVTAGKTLSSSLKKNKRVIPGFMIRIIQAGEKSGTLEKSMQELSDQFESRVTNRVKTITLLIEPLLLLIVGLLVGGLMLAIIAPIYNLIGQIGQR